MPDTAVGSAGLLVLGMHRSGTSALAHVLKLGGADIGSRVLGASVGNETGHWEDALAVEIHERLLSSFGARWNEPFALPANWARGEAAAEARDSIRGYLEANRSSYRLWVAKDPRLSLFAGLWREAAAELHLPLGVVFVLRHPMEVARSLAARDGIAPGRGMLLWLDYTLAAAAEAEQSPCTMIEYSQLLAGWRGCVERVRGLPGGEALAYDETAAALVDDFLDRGLRHHRESGTAGLPRVVAEVWEILAGFAQVGALPKGTAAKLAKRVADVRELLHPLLDESRVTQRLLWERIAGAEAQLVELAATTKALPTGLEELREHMDRHRADLVDAFSTHVLHMQTVTADAMQAKGAAEGQAQVARQLAPRIQAVEALLEPLPGLSSQVQSLANHVDKNQEVISQALQSAAVNEAKRGAAVEAQLIALGSLIPRHEEVISALAKAELTLTRAQAKLQEKEQILLEAGRVREQEWRELQEVEQQVQLLIAECDARQRDLVSLRLEGERLRDLAGQFEQVKASHSWRWTRPLRVARRILAGKWSPSDASRLRGLTRNILAKTPWLSHATRSRLIKKTLATQAGQTADLPDATIAPMIRLAEQQTGMPDVFVWSVIDWHFRTQRPQHLARALAEKGHRVYYISVNFINSDQAGFHIDPLDGDGRLYQIHLNLAGAPLIYSDMPTPAQIDALKASLGELLAWTRTQHSVSLIQHPYWSALTRAVPDARVVYDCMDHHAGFENNSAKVLESERKLVNDSELVIVTSSWLQAEFSDAAREIVVIRNACEFEFFKSAPAEVFRDEHGRQVIGYYGAIAEWFDLALVRRVAESNPRALVVLVGHDSIGAAALLADLPNVRMVGEVPYKQLPYWLHAFDVCLLPFKVIPLTLATNPVKIYEYISAGKPVVAVDLPEMAQFGDLIRTAADADGFVNAVAVALAAPKDASMCRKRQAFAAQQTWLHRAEALDAALQRLVEPCVSVVVLTYNNLQFTQACLFSIEAYSDYRNLEVIVVDNASSDGSVDFFNAWVAERSAAGHKRRIILNDTNLGFAAGNNIGLAAASGAVLVMLNNDTYVTPGWIRTLCSHLRGDESLGLVGPVTNNIGNEARIEIAYADMNQMIQAAGEYTRRHPGRVRSMETVAFFCVALSRAAYESVGALDEAFGQGFFEDDDYCRRAQLAGWKIACAEDVFIHHHLSASFDRIKPERRAALFEKNKAIYEAKWGAWQPHVYRNDKCDFTETEKQEQG